MVLLGINWLNTSITLLTVIYVFVCASMIFLILLQRPKQEGLGAAFGASTAGEIFGSRVTSVLQRGTVYLASAFFVITLVLAILVQRKNSSMAQITRTEAIVAPAESPASQPVSLQTEIPAAPVTSTTSAVTEPVVATPESDATIETEKKVEDAIPAETPAPQADPK